MDVSFNEQERMLQERSREFLEREVPLDLVRAMEEDDRGYPVDLWRKLAELGWLGIAFPEEYGGEGWRLVDLVIVAEQMGRVLTPTPYLPTVVMGGLTVLDGGSDEQKHSILPRIARGDLVMTAAYMEPNRPHIGFGDRELATTARPQGDGYLLNGEKHFVQYAHVADVILTLARDEASGDPVWLLVDRGSRGIDVTPFSTTGGDHQCHVTFADTPVPAGNRLPGDGWELLDRLLQRGAVATCGYASGAAQKVLEFTVEYARTRVQFGRPIATFQAVRHRCADMAVEVDGARFITYEAAWGLSEGLPSELEVSVAKAYVSDAVRDVMAHGHQVHGAMGFSEEHPMPLYSRRAKMTEVLFGNANLHRERVAERLGL
ncbi:MAG: acyl-CoA dehydrogenase family protein [Dehalococcoidia bacterium]